MSIFGETYSDPLTDDPSPYEQAMAEILQAQRIMAQTKKLDGHQAVLSPTLQSLLLFHLNFYRCHFFHLLFYNF